MSAVSRLFLALVGAVLGANLFGPAGRVVGAVVGGLVALGAAELNALNARVRSLDEELKRLSRDPQRVDEGTRGAVATTTTMVLATTMASVAAEVTDMPTPVRPRWDGEAQTQPTMAPSKLPPGDVPAETEFPPVRWVREFLTGGNAVVRVGVVVLLFGVAFLLRYMAEHTQVPIELRLSGVASGSLALLAVGWRLRVSRRGYALALQGGAIGILYLTVFAALRLYSALPVTIAFPILVTVAALSAVLAVSQNSLALAVLGVSGGFLAPVLASTGQGSSVVLFSYYAVLNAGILAMAWFKAWRPLNILGFTFTFVIGTAWGVLRYGPELFGRTEPFLILFFLFYVAIVVLFTLRQPVKLTGYIDGILVFGTPIVVFALQSSMLHDRLMPLAYSAVTMSAVYLAGAWLLRRWAPSQALLAEAFIAIGVALLTLAVPLALNARWNLAAWSLEGVALIWVGCRQRRLLARLAGALLLVACGVIAATEFQLATGRVVLLAADYAGSVLLSVASIVSACMLHRHRPHLRSFEQPIAVALFAWGLWWWSASGVSELLQFWPARALAGALILFTFTTLLCCEIWRRMDFAAAGIAALLQLPIMLLMSVIAVGSVSHPAADGGWLGWLLAFIGLYGVMYRLEGVARGPIANLLHVGATWLFCGIFSWEAAWQTGRAVAGSGEWSMAVSAVIPLAVLGSLPWLVGRVSWPFGKNRETYLFLAGAGIALFLVGWSVVANLSSEGNFAPLGYCPLVNPLDLVQVFVLLILLHYLRSLRGIASAGFPRLDEPVAAAVLAALAFLWLNAVLLRTLHRWFGVPSGWNVLLNSTLVQTSLSLFWTLLAFAIMLFANRRRQRPVWVVGASLLGVVIAKLFLVDLSRVGSIERIVSFVGVGLLMLVVGYLSPMPPAKRAAS